MHRGLLVFLCLLSCSLLCSFFACSTSSPSVEAQLAAAFPEGDAPVLRSVRASAIDLEYIVSERVDAPVLFFVHGAPGDLMGWMPYFRDSALTARFELVSVGRPGYAAHGTVGEYADLAVQSKILSNILRHYKDRDVILIGHSYGGSVVARMAMDYPDLVDGLLLLAPALDPALEDRAFWRSWLRGGWAESVLPRGILVANEEILHLEKDLTKMTSGYATLSSGVYYVHGAYDVVLPVENALYANRMIVHSNVFTHIVAKANHFIIWTHVDAIKQGIFHLAKQLNS